jgi:hypothetical protein
MGAFSAPLVALLISTTSGSFNSKQFPELQPAFHKTYFRSLGVEKHKDACLRISLC